MVGGEERLSPTISEIDSERESLVKHNLGWAPGVALCGCSITPREARPGWPDCVVCLDLLSGLTKDQYMALWRINQ